MFLKLILIVIFIILCYIKFKRLGLFFDSDKVKIDENKHILTINNTISIPFEDIYDASFSLNKNEDGFKFIEFKFNSKTKDSQIVRTESVSNAFNIYKKLQPYVNINNSETIKKIRFQTMLFYITFAVLTLITLYIACKILIFRMQL